MSSKRVKISGDTLPMPAGLKPLPVPDAIELEHQLNGSILIYPKFRARERIEKMFEYLVIAGPRTTPDLQRLIIANESNHA